MILSLNNLEKISKERSPLLDCSITTGTKLMILIHQPLGGAQGQATDIEIQAAEIIRIKKSLNEILASNTGQSIKKIEKDTDRDYIMTPTEALEYGMIDKVVSRDAIK